MVPFLCLVFGVVGPSSGEETEISSFVISPSLTKAEVGEGGIAGVVDFECADGGREAL